MVHNDREARRPDGQIINSIPANREPFVQPVMVVTRFERKDVISHTDLPGIEAIATPAEPF